MIQRKQTLFLLFVLVLSLLGAMLQVGVIEPVGMGASDDVYSLCIVRSDGTHDYVTFPLLAFYTVNGILSLVTIFLYNNRILQMKLCRVGIILELASYVALGYLWTCVFPLLGTFHPSCSVCLPVICCILYFMAHSGISKDEKLVRSMDRIR